MHAQGSNSDARTAVEALHTVAPQYCTLLERHIDETSRLSERVGDEATRISDDMDGSLDRLERQRSELNQALLDGRQRAAARVYAAMRSTNHELHDAQDDIELRDANITRMTEASERFNPDDLLDYLVRGALDAESILDAARGDVDAATSHADEVVDRADELVADVDLILLDPAT